VVLLVAVENPVGGGAEPGVDLAWGRDPLGLVDKAITGGLDRLLDPLFGGVGVKRGELGAQLAAALPLDIGAEQLLGVRGGRRGGLGRVHHYYRAASRESGPPFPCRCILHPGLRDTSPGSRLEHAAPTTRSAYPLLCLCNPEVALRAAPESRYRVRQRATTMNCWLAAPPRSEAHFADQACSTGTGPSSTSRM